MGEKIRHWTSRAVKWSEDLEELTLEEIDETFPPGDGSLVAGLVARVRELEQSLIEADAENQQQRKEIEMCEAGCVNVHDSTGEGDG